MVTDTYITGDTHVNTRSAVLARPPFCHPLPSRPQCRRPDSFAPAPTSPGMLAVYRLYTGRSRAAADKHLGKTRYQVLVAGRITASCPVGKVGEEQGGGWGRLGGTGYAVELNTQIGGGCVGNGAGSNGAGDGRGTCGLCWPMGKQSSATYIELILRTQCFFTAAQPHIVKAEPTHHHSPQLSPRFHHTSRPPTSRCTAVGSGQPVICLQSNEPNRASSPPPRSRISRRGKPTPKSSANHSAAPRRG